MKKQQKIIKLRTAANIEVAKPKAKIDFARSVAADKRARIMVARAAELKGLEAGSTERFDVLAKYKAMLAEETAQHAAIVANLKFDIQQIKAKCEQQCAECEDDPEPENNPEPEKKQPQQETVYCDGSEHSARIVARRLINKLPHIPRNGHLYVHVVWDTYGDNQEYFVSVLYGDKLRNETEIFSAQRHTAELEAAFVDKARRMFNEEPVRGNSHVAEPIAHALDAFFGGNPVEQVDNLIADTVKDGKGGGNE